MYLALKYIMLCHVAEVIESQGKTRKQVDKIDVTGQRIKIRIITPLKNEPCLTFQIRLEAIIVIYSKSKHRNKS